MTQFKIPQMNPVCAWPDPLLPCQPILVHAFVSFTLGSHLNSQEHAWMKMRIPLRMHTGFSQTDKALPTDHRTILNWAQLFTLTTIYTHF